MRSGLYTALSAALTLGTACALGLLLLRQLRLSLYRIEIFPLAVLCGSVLLNAFVFACCAMGIGREGVFHAFCMCAILLAILSKPYAAAHRFVSALGWNWKAVLAAGLAPAISAYMILSLPSQSKGDILMHRVSRGASDYQNLLPGNSIYFCSAVMGRYNSVAYVHLALLVSMALLVASFWRRFDYPKLGVCAAILTVVTPLSLAGRSLAYSRLDFLAVPIGVFYLVLMCRPGKWVGTLLTVGCIWEYGRVCFPPLAPMQSFVVAAFSPGMSLLVGASIRGAQWFPRRELRRLLSAALVPSSVPRPSIRRFSRSDGDGLRQLLSAIAALAFSTPARIFGFFSFAKDELSRLLSDHRRFFEHLALAVVLAVLLWFSWPGIHKYFVDDDVTSLRYAIAAPAGTLLYQTFAFSPEGYRPIGLLWYKAMREIAGLHQLPFRIVPMVILIFNLGLMGLLTFTLTQSTEITLLAMLLASFHSRMIDLYFSSSDIYDILCYAFYFAALVTYIRRRDQFRPIGWRGAVILLFQILGLGAKEMAVTLPFILLAFEASLYVGEGRRTCGWRRWWTDAGWLIGCGFAISVIFSVRRLAGADTFLKRAYHPSYSPDLVLDNWRSYLGQMCYGHSLSWVAFIVGLGFVLGAALAFRSKVWVASAALILIAPLPVLFVFKRGLNMMYIPMTGWAIFGAALIHTIRRKLLSRAHSSMIAPAAVFLCTTLFLCWAHYTDRPDHRFPTVGQVQSIEPFLESLKQLHPALPSNPLIRLLNDPFSPDEWFASMILEIYFERPGLEVRRDKVAWQRAAIGDRKFNVILDWREGHLVQVGDATMEEDPVRIPISDVFDLHSVPPRDVKPIVVEYLAEARRSGFKALRIIHGRGIGVQREIVRSVLAQTPFVESFGDAPMEAGGWGATVVTLREPGA